MKIMRYVIIICAQFILLLLGDIIYTPFTFAAGTTPDLTVSPYIYQTTIQPGTQGQLVFNLRDNTDSPFAVKIEFMNFSAPADKSGTPNYFATNPAGNDNTYYPVNWFSTQSMLVTIPAQTYIKIPMSVMVPSNATPGGHYGGVEFEEVKNAGNGGNVSLTAKIGVPILITVPGNITHHVAIKSFSIQPGFINYFSFIANNSICWFEKNCNPTASMDFQNTGNIHEAPIGLIEIYNMFGNKVQTLEYNPNRSLVLPNSERIFSKSIALSSLGGLKIGPYTAKLSMAYDDRKTPIFAQTTFWVFDWALVLYIVVILLLAIGIYEYKRNSSKIKNRVK